MRGMLIAALCAAALAGCAGDDKLSPEEQLAGTWATENHGCLFGFTFDDSDQYEIDLICQLQGGGVGTQAEVGTYTADEKTLRMTPHASSCKGEPGAENPTTGGYSLKGDTLDFANPSGAVQLLRVKDSQKQATGSGGVQSFGCWSNDLQTFTPRKIEKL